MPSPTIKFRLSTYQLARGLSALRKINADIPISSVHELVKLIYFDWCSKIITSSNIETSIFEEISKLLPKHKIEVNPSKEADILAHAFKMTAPAPTHTISPTVLPKDMPTESEKSTVTDFSLPTEFLTSLEDNNDSEQ